MQVADTVDPLAELTQVEVPRSDEAIAVLAAFYELETGAELPPIRVTWVAERIPFGDTSVIGLHRGCDDIWVTWWEGPRLSKLALAHEVGHCARATVEGSGDGQHADPLWWASDGIAERARRELARASL